MMPAVQRATRASAPSPRRNVKSAAVPAKGRAKAPEKADGVFLTVEEAAAQIKAGRMIIVVDDMLLRLGAPWLFLT